MIQALTQEGWGVDVVSAAAGTGKTFTLDAARHAWESNGYRVLGAALAGRAAEELQSSAAIPSVTLTKLNVQLRTGEARFDDRTVVVIDEVGMEGTRALAPILDAADRADAEVALVGDPKQLSEIDAGGVLRGLSARLRAIELVENRSQLEACERDSLDQLRSGDVQVAVDEYQRRGRVVTGRTAGDVRRAMVADWWSHRKAGESAVMMAVRRSDVDDLNSRARFYLVATGQVSGPALIIDERPYQAGDTVICLRNDRRLGITNGTRATIVDVDERRRTLTIETPKKRVVLPADYLEAGHVAHGYATTIHKAQGATFDRGLLLGSDELHRDRGYVGMSRGRISNHIYIVGGIEIGEAIGHGPGPIGLGPIDAVQQALTVETDKRLAVDTGDAPPEPLLGELLIEGERLGWLAEVRAGRTPDTAPDLGVGL